MARNVGVIGPVECPAYGGIGTGKGAESQGIHNKALCCYCRLRDRNVIFEEGDFAEVVANGHSWDAERHAGTP